MSVSAIILAGGQGSRMGKNENKVFLEINNHLVIDYSFHVLNNIFEISEIICVYKCGEKKAIKDRAEKIVTNKELKLIEGGAKRQDSVSNALKVMNTANDYFLIHDGARPFINEKFVQMLINKVKEYQAVIPGVALENTIKIHKDNFVISTLNRSDLVAIQTPQIFKMKFSKYLLDPENKGTDDSSFIEAKHKVKIVDGLKYNIKITTIEDLWYAKSIIGKVVGLKW